MSNPASPSRRISLRFFRKTPQKTEDQDGNVHALSLASPKEKFIGKFYSESQEMGYWTLALDVENTVGEICDLLADKTGVPRGSYYLLRRAKGKFGIRKDTQLTKDRVFSEIRKPDDCLFIVALHKQERKRLKQYQQTPKKVQMPTVAENMVTITTAPFASQLASNGVSTPNTDLIQKKMGRPRGLTRGFSAPGMTAENIQQLINSEGSPKNERIIVSDKSSPSRFPSSLAVDPVGSPTKKFGLGKSPSGLVSSLFSSSLRKTQSIDNFSSDGYTAESENVRQRDRTRSGSPKTPSIMRSSPSTQSVMKGSPSTQTIIKNSPPTPTPLKNSQSLKMIAPPPMSLDSGPAGSYPTVVIMPGTPRMSADPPPSNASRSPLTPRTSLGTIQRAQQPAPVAASEPDRRISRADSRSDDALNRSRSPGSSPSEGEQESSRSNGASIYSGRNALSAQTKSVRRRSSPSSKSQSSRLSVKEAMSMLRLYTQDDGDPEGPCFTIAITPITTSLEVCSVIESRLTVPESSMRICIAAKLSESDTFQRKLKDDEYILEARDRWNDQQPSNQAFFFLLGDERVNLNDISMRPALSSPIVPHDNHKSVATESSAFRSVQEEKAYRRRSVPIFLGGTAVKDNSKDSTDSDSGDTPRQSMECDGVDSTQSEPGTPNSNSAIWAPSSERLSLTPKLVVWISPNELQIVKKVGAGGFSKVYLGKYKNRQVAIKTLKGTSTEDQVESFKKEFDILGLINNPHLIHFYGACIAENGQNDPTLSIILEYCSQGNLFEALNNKKLDLDWQTFFKWPHQALSGVLCLHSMVPPLVHRDLKSQNLLLDSNWNVKVADFGLSRTMTMTNAASLGMLRGTMAYCAPEIYNGQMFSEKSDVFSMGIVMWEMIERIMKGKYYRPYYDYPEINFDFQVIIQTARNGIRPTLDSSVPESLREIVSMCWSSDPASRPACETVINAIQAIHTEYRANKQAWESLRRPKDE